MLSLFLTMPYFGMLVGWESCFCGDLPPSIYKVSIQWICHIKNMSSCHTTTQQQQQQQQPCNREYAIPNHLFQMGEITKLCT